MEYWRAVLRRGVALAFGALLLLGVFGAASSRAQVMHDDGLPLPWFHNRAQQMARQACEDDLPECRDSVRRQLVTEKMITNLLPWVLLCLVMLGAFVYVRRQEAVREGRRNQAARQHAREATQRNARKGRGDTDDRRPRDNGNDDDLGLGHPNDRP